jgi:hypothetical protein
MSQQLSAERVVEKAQAMAGLSDFGGDEFREPLAVLLRAIGAESGIAPERFAEVEGGIAYNLHNRLKIIEDRKRFPGIASEVIEKPLFILGLPRSGTTAMQALLAADPKARTTLHWELLNPSPPPETATYLTDPRIVLAEAQVEGMVKASPDIRERHPFDARLPEECGRLFDLAVMNQGSFGSYYVPSYLNWLLAHDYRDGYPIHKLALQHFQHRHKGSHWVLKSNKHMFTLERLFETYPDLRLVWLHRDPAQTLPSLCSFIKSNRVRLKPDTDPRALGPDWTTMQEIALRRALSSRDRMNVEKQICDVSYYEMLADPAGTIQRIYAYFGMPFDDSVRAGVLGWLRDNPQDKFGRHKYTPEMFGLDGAGLRERFAFYTERFDVRSERAMAAA